MIENNVAQVIDIVPVAGSAYQLISSGIYYRMGKTSLAEEQAINGHYRYCVCWLLVIFKKPKIKT